MKKNESGRRAVFTAVVLLILVAAAVWVLRTRGREQTELPMEEAQPPVVSEQPSEPEPVEPEPEKESEEVQPVEDPDEVIRQEAERARFLPDYDSAPLLNTTPIKNLTMQVGAAEGEVRLNWLSPSSARGQVTWYTVQNGDFKTFDAETAASTTVPGYYVNKVVVTDAQPGLTYAYKAGNAAGWSPEYKYTVPEDKGGDITFLAVSDAQIGQAQYEEVEDTIKRWDAVTNRLTNYVPEAQFMFHMGDQVAVYGDQSQYDGFLDHLGLYRIPLAPVVGNHDVPNEFSMEEVGLPGGKYFYEHFNVPHRSDIGQSQFDLDGDYYFTRGNVLFIVLNSSTIQETDIHEQYVPRVVNKFPDIKWRVLVQHFPAYSSVEKYQNQLDPHIKNSLAYIAADNDIDLVLSGHDHAYSRTAFVDRKCQIIGDYDTKSGGVAENPDGTMYVTCGTASGCIYQAVTPEERVVFQGQPEVPTALKVDVTDNELHLTTYLVDSWTVYDEYTIKKD